MPPKVPVVKVRAGNREGNGVIVQTVQGPMVLTVHHILEEAIEEARTIEVEGEEVECKLEDEFKDLALLECPKKLRRVKGISSLDFISLRKTKQVTCYCRYPDQLKLQGKAGLDEKHQCLRFYLDKDEPRAREPGISGAPLFTEKGLLGIVTDIPEDEGLPFLAVKPGFIREFLEEKNYRLVGAETSETKTRPLRGSRFLFEIKFRVKFMIIFTLLMGVLFLGLFVKPGPLYWVIWPVHPPPAGLTLEIIEPVDGGTVDCPSGKPCRLTVRGRTNLRPGSDYRIYVAVLPLEPFGGGWWPQMDPAVLEPDGTWTASSVWLGSPQSPPEEGDRFQLVAFIIHEHWRWIRRVKSLDDLPPHTESGQVEVTVE